MDLATYDEKYSLAPKGFHNGALICHFNAMLQGLLSCTSVIKTALENRDYLWRTLTGKAFLDLVQAYANEEGGKEAPSDKVELASAEVLKALMKDLASRRPRTVFGNSQESADEGLVLLLDMMEAPPQLHPVTGQPLVHPETRQPFKANPITGEALIGADGKPVLEESPISRLFLHRYNCELYCKGCKALVNTKLDVNAQFNLFHLNTLTKPPSSPEDFSEIIRRHVQEIDDYDCEGCKKRVAVYRVYKLTLIPEVIACLFNIYGTRGPRYFPETLSFPAAQGGSLNYLQVAQVEHHGSLHGGHYIARGLRQGGKVYHFNDTQTYPAQFNPSSNTYLVFYHYRGDGAASHQ